MTSSRVWFVLLALVAALSLSIAAACGGDDDDDSSGDTTGDQNTPGSSSSNPTTASGSGSGSGSGDTGPAAAPGEGRLEVGGKTYALTITECTFNASGPSKGTVEAQGTGPDGAKFDFTQFVLNDKWSQTDMSYDYNGDAHKIYVIVSSATKGASQATVDGKNVSWVATYRDLDVAANKQENIGEGKLNFTCE